MAGKSNTKRRGLEVELKFELTRGDVRRLCQADAFKGMQCAARPRRKTMRATYFDTPGHDLAQRGVSLRVRKESRRFVQCVKGKPPSGKGGGFARREWEWPVPGPMPDLSLLKEDDDVKALFKGIDLQTLMAVFSTDITRQTRELSTPEGAEVKCDIDQGVIVAGNAQAPIYEMELELLSGDSAALMRLGQVVTELVPARLSQRTKAHRGYTLHRGEGAVWAKARTVELPAKPTGEDVLVASLTEGLRHLIANEDCVLTRCDVEGVHQMRVAMRRLRALLSTYKPVLAPGSFERLAGALKAAAGELGPARDWDVFATEVLPPVHGAFADDAELEVLARAVEDRRDVGYVRARHLIQSPDYARMLTDVLAWGETKPWRAPGGDVKRLDAPGEDLAGAVLDKRHDKMMKAGKGLAEQPAAERHKLRIAGKKVRYAAEFFAPLYPAKKSKPYFKALKALQNELGHLNDLANARGMLDELVAGARGAKGKSMARAAGIVEGWHGHLQQTREADLMQAWRRFTKVKTFW